MELTILFGLLFCLLVLGIPVAFSLGISAFFTMLFMGISPVMVAMRMTSGVSNFVLLAIPFFIYAGELMRYGQISHRLVNLATNVIGHVPGGLGQVNVLSSMLFGGISGSAVADASALGSTLVPMMKEKGYDTNYAVNVTITSSITGLLIPPSHNMIIYAIAAGGAVSISSLFLAGIIPGILTGLCLMVVAYIIALQKNYPKEQFPGWKTVMSSLLSAFPALLTAVIIVGGVLTGVFTATESSAIAVIYAILVTWLFYHSLSWNDFIQATVSSIKTTAMVLFLIGSASSFAWMLSVNEVPLRLFHSMQSLSDDPTLILMIVNIALLLLGTFMDMSPLILIATPIFLPIVKEIGVDPVQFGVIMMLNLGIGLVTPPVGSVLFVGCAVAKVRMEDVLRSIWPFYIALLVALMLVTYIPAISLTIPRLLQS